MSGYDTRVPGPVRRKVERVRHGKVSLALHHIRSTDDYDGRPLLVLHGLGERAPRRSVSIVEDNWPGPILALEFTGHGDSTVPMGGGYTAELLMGDVDATTEKIGPVTLLGRGMGGYIALLAAGATPSKVKGALIVDGPGFAGGGSLPSTVHIAAIDDDPGPPDPWVLAEMSRDLRPPSYAVQFLQQAVTFSGIENPVAASSVVQPRWLKAILAEPGAVEESIPSALARFAAI